MKLFIFKKSLKKMLLPRIWISVIMLYNVICGILSIINPSILEVLFPGSATLFGTKSTMFSRVLGSYALSIAGIRGIFVIRPTSPEAFWGVIWTFFVFESMFAIEFLNGLEFKTIMFGVVAGTISVIMMTIYKVNGWFMKEYPKKDEKVQ